MGKSLSSEVAANADFARRATHEEAKLLKLPVWNETDHHLVVRGVSDNAQLSIPGHEKAAVALPLATTNSDVVITWKPGHVSVRMRKDAGLPTFDTSKVLGFNGSKAEKKRMGSHYVEPVIGTRVMIENASERSLSLLLEPIPEQFTVPAGGAVVIEIEDVTEPMNDVTLVVKEGEVEFWCDCAMVVRAAEPVVAQGTPGE